jgi:hypothetical protein
MRPVIALEQSVALFLLLMVQTSKIETEVLELIIKILIIVSNCGMLNAFNTVKV